MQPFRYHAFVCTQQKPEGVPNCFSRGGQAVLFALQKEIVRAGLDDAVQVTTSGSLGLCDRGPNIIVYPEGIWYTGVQPSDVVEIVEKHFRDGRPVERLLYDGGEENLHAEIASWRERARAAHRTLQETATPIDDVMGIARAFMESRALLTALELDAFRAIAGGATVDKAARRLGTDARATEMLLNALVAMKLALKEDGVFSPTEQTARYLAGDAPESQRDALMHTVQLWRSWDTLTDTVRAGTSVYEGRRAESWTEPFIAAMHRNATLRAPLVMKAHDFSNYRRLLDVGGGSGGYTIAFAEANPSLIAIVFDLAPVIAIADRHIEAAGLTDRVTTRIGDLSTDDLGENFDAVFISAICHMNSPDGNVALFKKAHGALSPRGEVIVQDFLLSSDKTSPRPGVLFALNMLVNTKAGNAYSDEEYRDWLGQAGFRAIRTRRMYGPNGLVIGVK